MSKYIEKVEKNIFPLVKLRNVVVFPGLPTSIELSESSDIASVNAALETDSTVFVVSCKPESGKNEELYNVGVTAKVKQAMNLPDGHMRVLIEAKKRAEILSVETASDCTYAEVFIRTVSLTDNGGLKGELLTREAISQFQEFLKFLPKVSNEIVAAVQAIKDPGFLADFIAANVIYKLESRQEILSEINPLKRIEKLLVIMENEKALLESEVEIQAKVKQRIDKNQREYYLREQMKVIQNELGDGEFSDIDEYEEKIAKAALPEHVEEKLRKELSKMLSTK